MIELSAQDYAAILAAIEPYKFDSGSQVAEMLDACYRAGLAAGIERSAKVVEGGRFLTDTAPIKLWADECAAAIRLLNAPAAP